MGRETDRQTDREDRETEKESKKVNLPPPPAYASSARNTHKSKKKSLFIAYLH